MRRALLTITCLLLLAACGVPDAPRAALIPSAVPAASRAATADAAPTPSAVPAASRVVPRAATPPNLATPRATLAGSAPRRPATALPRTASCAALPAPSSPATRYGVDVVFSPPRMGVTCPGVVLQAIFAVPSSVEDLQLRVDGADIAPTDPGLSLIAAPGRLGIEYRPPRPLAVGPHEARLSFSYGPAAQAPRWTFEVADVPCPPPPCA